MKHLSQFDLFSYDYSLNDSDGNRMNKNIIGGILTMMCSVTVFAGIVFFSLQFLNRLSFSILTSSSISNNFTVVNYTKFPFMVRIKQSSVPPFDDPEKIVAMSIFKYSALTDEEIKNSLLTKVVYNGRRCNINDTNLFHSEYQSMFSAYEDTSTFLCTDYGGQLHDLIGTYGALYPNQYFTVNISPCVNQTNSHIVCESPEKIRAILNEARVDIRTLNYKINNYMMQPEEAIVDNFKYDASYSLNRRIWFNYKSINYTTDVGYIFEDVNISKFFMIDRITIEVNLSDLTMTAAAGAFLRITSTNLNENITYIRAYLKVQNLLANLGGLIKGVTIIANIICLYLTRDMMIFKFLKEVPSLRYEVFLNLRKKHGAESQRSHLQKITNNISIAKTLRANNLKSIKSELPKLKGDIHLGQESIVRELAGENFNYPFSWFDLLIPVSYCKKDHIYYDTLKIANRIMTHKTNIFRLMNQQEILMQNLEINLDKNELEVLKFMFNPTSADIKSNQNFNRKLAYVMNHNPNYTNIHITQSNLLANSK